MIKTKKLKIWSNLKEQHPFHLVKPSGWPLLVSINLLYFILIIVTYYVNHGKIAYTEAQLTLGTNDSFFLGFICQSKLIQEILLSFVYCPPVILFHKVMSLSFIVIIGAWFWDIIVESTYEGHHTQLVQQGLRYGMILFIVSEVMFFFGLFWAFFHSSLAATIEVGALWPPKDIITFNPWIIPLLNTLILLTSGVTITYAHNSLLDGNFTESSIGLSLTIILGLTFTRFQIFEYEHAYFSLEDTVYGSVFYLITGFHGFHVFLGTVFLIVCLLRHTNYHFTNRHHFGFEAAAWYWHFVDVVWLFVFLSIYFWGS